MADQQLSCPVCASRHVVKNGRRKERQLYRCQEGGHQFKSPEGLGHHFPVEVVALAIHGYYWGMSYREIARALEFYGYTSTTISSQTPHHWVKRYIDRAIREIVGHRAVTGGHWVVVLMPYLAGDGWFVVDSDTGYILSAHFSFGWHAQAAREVIRKALAAAGPRESVISCIYRLCDVGCLTEGQSKYDKRIKAAIRRELPNATQAVSEEGVDPDDLKVRVENYLPAWANETDKRGRFRKIEAGQRCLNGGVIMYNFFIEQKELGGRTPGQAAKVNAPFGSWLDVVKMGLG